MTTAAGQPTSNRRPERERATVLARLDNGLFRLQTADGREVVAHAALDLRKALTRLLPGDPVLIEISLFDPNKARICSQLKSTQKNQHESPPHPSQQREQS
jgi:translation initiation factor IF-1